MRSGVYRAFANLCFSVAILGVMSFAASSAFGDSDPPCFAVNGASSCTPGCAVGTYCSFTYVNDANGKKLTCSGCQNT
jgi:hypothetical protein